MRFGRSIRVLACACMLAVTAACGRGHGTDTVSAGDAKNVRQVDVRFRTSDGRILAGRVFGSSKVGVTLAHMYPADATSWYPAAQRIAQAGYMALAFNFRGFGASGGTKQIVKAPIDIEAGRQLLLKRGAKDVAYVGASMGGTASIIAAGSQDPLAVVAISAPTRFMGLDAPTVAKNVQRPVLLMASRNDDAAFQALKEYEIALPNPEDTKIYEGDAHGTNLLDARPEAVDEIIAFLKRYAPLSSSAQPTK